LRCKGKKFSPNYRIIDEKNILFCTNSLFLSNKNTHTMPSKIAIFASGSGSNAENIVNYFADNSKFDFRLFFLINPMLLFINGLRS